MTTNPAPTNRQSDQRTRADGADRNSQWKDTVDDWNTVLSRPRGVENGRTETADPEPHGSVDPNIDTQSIGSANAQSMQLADGSEFVRIGPISDPLLRSIAAVLPDTWLADTDVQQIVQWVVYLYVRETNPAEPPATRTRAAIDQTAATTNTAAKTVNYVCTTCLYRDQPGVSASSFRSDLEAISTQVTDSLDN